MPAVKKTHRTRKVDAEVYMPDPGDWEETNIIHDFGDGWLICEDRTEYDRRLMAKLTLTCVTSLIPHCDPGPNLEEYKQNIIAKYERTYGKGSKIAEQEAKYELSNLPKSGWDHLWYKLAHVRDPESRPRTCILLAKKAILDDPKKRRLMQYISDDLGQAAPIILDGEEYMIEECRIGTGKAAPMAVEERIIEWYKEVTGIWNEESYLRQLSFRRPYTAYTSHPASLQEYRRPEPVPA